MQVLVIVEVASGTTQQNCPVAIVDDALLLLFRRTTLGSLSI